MRAFIAALALALIAVVNADVFNVTVGSNGTLSYHPWTVTAETGDVIIFHFVSKNHTVTRSTFADPCTPLPAELDGTNSGFRPASNTTHPTFNFTVTDSSTPDWFFCAQKGHCFNGMVFAVNPTPERSFGAFQAKARSLNPNNTTPSTSVSSASSSVSSTGTSATPTLSDNAAMGLGENTFGVMTAIAVLFGLVL